MAKRSAFIVPCDASVAVESAKVAKDSVNAVDGYPDDGKTLRKVADKHGKLADGYTKVADEYGIVADEVRRLDDDLRSIDRPTRIAGDG